MKHLKIFTFRRENCFRTIATPLQTINHVRWQFFGLSINKPDRTFYRNIVEVPLKNVIHLLAAQRINISTPKKEVKNLAIKFKKMSKGQQFLRVWRSSPPFWARFSRLLWNFCGATLGIASLVRHPSARLGSILFFSFAPRRALDPRRRRSEKKMPASKSVYEWKRPSTLSPVYCVTDDRENGRAGGPGRNIGRGDAVSKQQRDRLLCPGREEKREINSGCARHRSCHMTRGWAPPACIYREFLFNRFSSYPVYSGGLCTAYRYTHCTYACISIRAFLDPRASSILAVAIPSFAPACPIYQLTNQRWNSEVSRSDVAKADTKANPTGAGRGWNPGCLFIIHSFHRCDIHLHE